MTESAPFLENFDENAPHIGGPRTRKISASAYFRPFFKILSITTMVISVVTMVLLITINIILGKLSWRDWSTQQSTKVLTKLMSAPLVVAGISALISFPILLGVTVNVVLLACIIPKVVDFIGGIQNSLWCLRPRYPNKGEHLPDPKCLHWKSVLTVLMGIVAGLSLLICIIYVVELLLRGIAIYRTKLWKKRLSSILPNEINIHFSMRVLRNERENAEGESAEESGRGPVYLS